MSNSIEWSFNTLLYQANTLNESTNKKQDTEIANRIKAQFYQRSTNIFWTTYLEYGHISIMIAKSFKCIPMYWLVIIRTRGLLGLTMCYEVLSY